VETYLELVPVHFICSLSSLVILTIQSETCVVVLVKKFKLYAEVVKIYTLPGDRHYIVIFLITL
jgi:hypothetical protein